jgi:hypothetical protein
MSDVCEILGKSALKDAALKYSMATDLVITGVTIFFQMVKPLMVNPALTLNPLSPQTTLKQTPKLLMRLHHHLFFNRHYMAPYLSKNATIFLFVLKSLVNKHI